MNPLVNLFDVLVTLAVLVLSVWCAVMFWYYALLVFVAFCAWAAVESLYRRR